MTDRLRVLLVEDEESDAELTKLALRQGGFELVARRVDTAAAMRQALDEVEWDVVISDFAMPGFDGLGALAIVRERQLDIPFLFVSGALGEERAVEAMRVGAHDYLLKGHLGRLAVAVRRELRASRTRRLTSTAEESARRHQRRLGLAVEASGVGIFESSVPADENTFVAQRCLAILGLEWRDLPEPEALAGWVCERIHPEDLAHFDAAWRAFMSGAAGALAVEVRVRHRLGHWLDLDVRAKSVLRNEAGGLGQFVGVVVDISERKQLEARLRQTQKMEAVGRLAGGVAHDFNNLLMAISTFGTLAFEALDPEHPARDDLQEVLNASRRAADLTNQLLTFSRMKKSSPRIIVVGDVVRELQRILERLLGGDVTMTLGLGPAGMSVRIDPGELEQVLVNLAVNARDAMPGGGRLTIDIARVTLTEPLSDHIGLDFAPGDFVLITATDTGTGMDAATLSHIFDPFFTTKELGKGTGLGLSTCYGIVHQAGGFIRVLSEVGRGTTFQVYLPEARGEGAWSPGG